MHRYEKRSRADLNQVLDHQPSAVKTTICLILPHLKLPSPRLYRQEEASFLGKAELGRLDERCLTPCLDLVLVNAFSDDAMRYPIFQASKRHCYLKSPFYV